MKKESLFNKFIRIIPWGLTVFLAIACGVLLYGIIDQAVTLDHRSQQCISIKKQLKILKCIVDSTAKGITKEQFIKTLERNGFRHFSKGSDQIVSGEVGFFFLNDRLVRVETDEEQKQEGLIKK